MYWTIFVVNKLI